LPGAIIWCASDRALAMNEGLGHEWNGAMAMNGMRHGHKWGHAWGPCWWRILNLGILTSQKHSQERLWGLIALESQDIVSPRSTQLNRLMCAYSAQSLPYTFVDVFNS